jgi:hypothetical protein
MISALGTKVHFPKRDGPARMRPSPKSIMEQVDASLPGWVTTTHSLTQREEERQIFGLLAAHKGATPSLWRVPGTR